MTRAVAASMRADRLLAAGAAALTLAGVVVAATRPVWLTEPLRAAVEGAGVAAPVAYVALSALAAPLHLSGLLVALSSVLWPLPVALALSFAGVLLGSVLTAALLQRAGDAARRYRGEWPAWLRRLTASVSRRPVAVGLVARVVVGTGLALEAFYLLAGYTRPQYLVATALGLAVWVAQALLGVTLLHELLKTSPGLAGALAAAPLLTVAGLAAVYRRRRSS